MTQQPRIDGRHRDRDGEVARNFGNILISTLRLTYGQNFAPTIDGGMRLRDVLHRLLDEQSLAKLIADLPQRQR